MGKKQKQGMKWQPPTPSGAQIYIKPAHQATAKEIEDRIRKEMQAQFVVEIKKQNDETMSRYRTLISAQQACVSQIDRLLTYIALIPNPTYGVTGEGIERYRQTLRERVDKMIAQFDSLLFNWRDQRDPTNVFILDVMEALERGDAGLTDLLQKAEKRDPIAYDTRLIIQSMVEQEQKDKYTPQATKERQQLKQRASEALQTAAKDRPSFRQWGRIKEHYLASNKSAYDNALMGENDREVYEYLASIGKTTLSDLMKDVPL